MRTLSTVLGVAATSFILAGCGGGHGSSAAMPAGAVHRPPSAVTAATAAQSATLLDRVKSLAGTWESTDDKGATHVSSVFTVTSNGSAVREVMLPGTPHEMTNMYTMDGPTLVMGNQPHMRSVAARTDDRHIALGFDGVSNLTGADQMYMGECTIEFVDADHIKTQWKSFEKGVPSEHSPVFTLTRKR
jgi:hypothetical protein